MLSGTRCVSRTQAPSYSTRTRQKSRESQRHVFPTGRVAIPAAIAISYAKLLLLAVVQHRVGAVLALLDAQPPRIEHVPRGALLALVRMRPRTDDAVRGTPQAIVAVAKEPVRALLEAPIEPQLVGRSTLHAMPARLAGDVLLRVAPAGFVVEQPAPFAVRIALRDGGCQVETSQKTQKYVFEEGWGTRRGGGGLFFPRRGRKLLLCLLRRSRNRLRWRRSRGRSRWGCA